MTVSVLSESTFEPKVFMCCDESSHADCGRNFSDELTGIQGLISFDEPGEVIDGRSDMSNSGGLIDIDPLVIIGEEFPESDVFDKDVGDILSRYDTEQQEDYDFTV